MYIHSQTEKPSLNDLAVDGTLNTTNQTDRKRMRDKQALMGVSSKWRIMYMQMRHIKYSFHYK